jgi:DNA-binding MarR family transcriptional regulator
MATITPAKPPVQADLRAAKHLLGLFPWMAHLWSTAVREAGVGSIGRYKTLGMLHGRGPIRAGELATLCGTTPSAISEVIEGLVIDGHVRRVDDPTDRRAVMVALTEKGETELERVGEFMTAAMVRVFDGLTTEQKSRLRSAIGDLNEILINPSAQKETRNVR